MIQNELSSRINLNDSDFGLIRIKKLVPIHSDLKSRINRIKLDRFSTDLHQTILKKKFELTRIQISEQIGLVLNKGSRTISMQNLPPPVSGRK